MRERILVAVLVAACAVGTVITAEGENRQEEDAAIAFDIVVDEVTCGLEEPLRLVVRDETTWAHLWGEIYRPVEPTPERPHVDFTREMLIAVAMGVRRSGGYDITMRCIRVKGETLEVTVHESHPSPDAKVSMTLTQPVEAVRLERHDQKVVFLDAKAARATGR